MVGHHLRLSNVIERISQPSCESFYATDTSHRKQEIFLYEYPLHWFFCPQKQPRQKATLRLYTPQTILTTETSLLTCACVFAAWTVMKLDYAAT
jgi:hypothetical protein